MLREYTDVYCTCTTTTTTTVCRRKPSLDSWRGQRGKEVISQRGDSKEEGRMACEVEEADTTIVIICPRQSPRWRLLNRQQVAQLQ